MGHYEFNDYGEGYGVESICEAAEAYFLSNAGKAAIYDAGGLHALFSFRDHDPEGGQPSEHQGEHTAEDGRIFVMTVQNERPGYGCYPSASIELVQRSIFDR
mgnify:FL=1